MMKKLSLIIAALTLCGSVAFSQNMLDAYRFGQTQVQGTARSMSMGNAFGALGGDITSLTLNPAGIAVYKSSEAVATLNLSNSHAKTNWLGTEEKKGKTKFNFDNIAYVAYFPTGRDEGLVSWNAGFSYNRVKNFNREYRMNTSKLTNGISDYAANVAAGASADDLFETNNYDPYESQNWLSVVTYMSGIIDGDRNFYNPYKNESYKMDYAGLSLREKGSIDQYNISFGLNFSEVFLFGATLAITDINYELKSFYDESYDKDNYYQFDNGLKTDGNGYGVNLGVIVRPADFLRLGVSYNSPVWYKMTDTYKTEAFSSFYTNNMSSVSEWEAGTPGGVYTDYELRSPDKWLFSAAFVVGHYGLLSVDYELTNYRNMKLYDHNGDERDFVEHNADIRNNFNWGNTVRLGAEARITPQFSIRAGGTYTVSPMKDKLKNGDIEVYTVGALPHYTVDKGNHSFSIGLGYRFTPQFYLDLACVATTYKEDAYLFSTMYNANGTVRLQSDPATLKTNRTQTSLTVGYKF